MCFAPDPPTPPPIPATPAPPTRSSEANRGAVAQELDAMKRRQGMASTRLTGGAGDLGYGSNVSRKTMLGQ